MESGSFHEAMGVEIMGSESVQEPVQEPVHAVEPLESGHI